MSESVILLLDVGDLVEGQVEAELARRQSEQDRRALVRGVAAGTPVSTIALSQRRR